MERERESLWWVYVGERMLRLCSDPLYPRQWFLENTNGKRFLSLFPITSMAHPCFSDPFPIDLDSGALAAWSNGTYGVRDISRRSSFLLTLLLLFWFNSTFFRSPLSSPSPSIPPSDWSRCRDCRWVHRHCPPRPDGKVPRRPLLPAHLRYRVRFASFVFLLFSFFFPLIFFEFVFDLGTSSVWEREGPWKRPSSPPSLWIRFGIFAKYRNTSAFSFLSHTLSLFV